MLRVARLSGGVALVASVLLVAPVSAAPAQRVSDTEHILFCPELMNASGATVFLVVGVSEQFGSFADAAYWPTGAPPPDDPAWIALGAEADVDGASLNATILMVEYVPSPDEPPFGDPVGEAVVQASLTAIGDPQAYRFGEAFGNQQFRREGVVQPYSVTGTLTLPNDAGTFDLSTCEGWSDTYTQFSNAPASFVARFSSFDLNCGWETELGFIGLSAAADEFGGYTDLFVFDGEDAYFGMPTGDVTFTPSAFEASYEIVSEATGDPAGSATASATLTEAGRINERFASGSSKTHVVGVQYLVSGSLSVTLEDTDLVLPMDETSCFAADATITDHVSARQGPRGKPLPNDAPEGALPIAIGDSVSVRNTGGTAFEPEAACVVSFPDGDFEVPISHTAWWTFTGTGDPVTVDTAGSTFDTVVGVYVDDGGTLTQVGCNDDVDSLQARLTVDTEAGVTYHLQVGGFAGETGTLVISVQ